MDTFQTRRVESREALTIRSSDASSPPFPFRNARWETAWSWPWRVFRQRGEEEANVSQILMVRSADEEMRRTPFGSQTSEVTDLVWPPLRVIEVASPPPLPSSPPSATQVLVSMMRIQASSDAVAMVDSKMGLNATAVMGERWIPFRVWWSWSCEEQEGEDPAEDFADCKSGDTWVQSVAICFSRSRIF